MREFDEKAGQFVRVGVKKDRKVREEPKIRTLKPETQKGNRRAYVEGTCECCQKELEVISTEDGDFCAGCMANMPWLK